MQAWDDLPPTVGSEAASSGFMQVQSRQSQQLASGLLVFIRVCILPDRMHAAAAPNDVNIHVDTYMGARLYSISTDLHIRFDGLI